MNVASRIEGLTKTRGVPLLVTAATREAARDAFEWTASGTDTVMGKSAAVETFVPARRRAP